MTHKESNEPLNISKENAEKAIRTLENFRGHIDFLESIIGNKMTSDDVVAIMKGLESCFTDLKTLLNYDGAFDTEVYLGNGHIVFARELRNHKSITTPEYILIQEHYDELADVWKAERFTRKNGRTVKRKPRQTLSYFLYELGFRRKDGALWNAHQIAQWEELLEGDSIDSHSSKVIIPALNLLTGHNWKWTVAFNKSLPNGSADKLQEVYYDTDVYTEEDVEKFAFLYFFSPSKKYDISLLHQKA